MERISAIIISPSCDNDCVFCRKFPPVNEVELKQQESLARENLDYHLKQGCTRLEISGGDPGEYRSIHNLVGEAKRKGMEFVQLSTNGVRLADPDLARQLAEAGLNAVRIPLYGSYAETHESVTRKKGSFEAAVQSLTNFVRLGLEVKVHCLVMQQNSRDLLNLFQLALRFADWRRISFSVPCFINAPDQYYIPVKDLREHVLPLVYYGTIRQTFARFKEIPMCVFGFDYPWLEHSGPPRMGLQQPRFRSPIEDMPTYRLKKKFDMCCECRVEPKCDGFFVNDVERYGTGDLKPIR